MSQIFVSKNNSTIIPLSAGASFIGATDILTSFQEVDINIAGEPDIAPATLYFEFSPNGTNWDISVPLTLAGPDSVPIILRSILPYFRIRYINGGTALSELRITTLFHRNSSMRLSRFLSQSIDPNEPVEIVRVAKSILPDGAATETTLDDLNSKFNTLGQKSMSGSAPVVFASDQSNLPVELSALSIFQTNQADVTNTAVQIVGSPLTGRKSISIKSLLANSENVYIGTSSAVTTGNGYELGAGDSIDIEIGVTQSIWAISALGTQRVCWMEIA